MKNIKYITIVVAFLVAITSCNQDAVMQTIDPKDIGSVDASFSSTNLAYKLSESDNGQLTILIQRGNSTTAAFVDLIIEGEGLEIFTPLANTVNFESGEYIKPILFSYDMDDIEPAKKYKFSVKIADEKLVSKSKIDKISVEAELPLDYELLGEGLFTSEFFEESWPQRVDHAPLTSTLTYYKLPDCYVSGYPFEFVDNGGEVTFDLQNIGYYYSDDHGYVYANPKGEAFANNTYIFTVQFVLPKSGAGFAGLFEETIKLPIDVLI